MSFIDNMNNLRAFGPPRLVFSPWSTPPFRPPSSPLHTFRSKVARCFFIRYMMDTVAVDRRSHYHLAESEPSGSLRDLFTL
jgi:hypothetical protein